MEKLNEYVIEPYRKKRTFYHSQGQFHVARERLIQRLVDDEVKSVLDVGCGHALGSKDIMARGIEYVGVDPIVENIEQARIDNPYGDFRVGYMQELPFDDESFDAVMDVTVWDILPNLNEMKHGLDECLRVAKRRYYSLNCTEKPRFMVERYMMIPMNFYMSFERLHYDPVKNKCNYLWIVDKEKHI